MKIHPLGVLHFLWLARFPANLTLKKHHGSRPLYKCRALRHSLGRAIGPELYFRNQLSGLNQFNPFEKIVMTSSQFETLCEAACGSDMARRYNVLDTSFLPLSLHELATLISYTFQSTLHTVIVCTALCFATS